MAFRKTELNNKCPVSSQPVHMFVGEVVGKKKAPCFLSSPGFWKTGLFDSKTDALDWLNDRPTRESFLEGVVAKPVKVVQNGSNIQKFIAHSPSGWVSDEMFPDPNRALAKFGLAKVTKVERVDEPDDFDDPLSGFEEDAGMKDADVDELIDHIKPKPKPKKRATK